MDVGKLLEEHGNALTLIKQQQFDPALRTFDRILIRHPEYVPGWQDRAALLDKLGCHFDAVINWDKAIALRPKEGGLYCNRGASFLGLNEFHLAIGDFDKGLEYLPNRAELHGNKGTAYRRLGRPNEAVPCFRRAIECEPDYADAHVGLAMCLLENQEFEEGWREFEWRWRHESMVPRGLKLPVWAGERAASPEQALLLVGEQGHGDVLQFIRYVPFVKERWGGKLYVEVRHPLARLAQNIEGVDKVVVLGERIPSEVVSHICMLSVPAIVGTEKGFIGPYIKADPALVEYFEKLVGELCGSNFRVGLCWAGMNREQNAAASAIDARRSLTLDQLGPLGMVKGVIYVSLQKGQPAQQVKMPPRGMRIVDTVSDLEDFWDTAALIANCDAVVSVDTAVVHLAAALGKPTFMLSRFDGCWRWHGDVPNSPWYPSLRQYRQKIDGMWTGPLDALTRDLQRAVATARKHAA